MKINYNRMYTNFNKLYVSKPLNYFQPETLNDLVYDVKRATKPLRVIGSKHTFNDISMTTTNGTIIDTSKLNKVLNINQENKTVTVQSGIKLHDLLRILDQYHLTLPVMTATSDISITGGISTGSHGSNVGTGSMSSLLVSAQFVTADGRIEQTDTNNIGAFRCSLGCLGAIYAVTLQCVDMFSIKEKVSRSSWKDIAEKMDVILQKYPYTQIDVDQFSKDLDSVVYLREKVAYDKSLGYAYEVLTGSSAGSWYIEIELAFPYELASTAIKAVSKFHRQYKKKYNVYTDAPLLIRFSSSDNTLISMASGRKTIYISTFFGKEYDPDTVNKFMWSLSDEMVKKYGARPHYGKQHNLDKQQMYQLYGNKYDSFLKIKNNYDPDGKFDNDYIKRIIQ